MSAIRLLTPVDIPQLCVIENTIAAYPWSVANFVSCFGERYFSYGIFQQDKLQAYYVAQCVAGEAQLFNLGVALSAQRQGYAKQLLAHLIAECHNRSVIELWLEVRASNLPAISLYQSYGFIETGIRTNYYRNQHGAEDAILMALPLEHSLRE